MVPHTLALLAVVSSCDLLTAVEPAPASATAAPSDPLVADTFAVPDGLVTNEYAYWNPSHPDAVFSPVFEVTSGTLLVRDGTGWSGVPDGVSPDATSSNGTGSAVFRMISVRDDLTDVEVAFELRNIGLVTTDRTPAQSYDGVHVMLRYVSQYQLYYATLNRRDGRIVIKKKVAGGPTNGGTYYELSTEVARAVPYDTWQDWAARVRTNPDGSVTLSLYADGAEVLSAVDDGSVGGPPLTAAGRVGIRGDNCDFQIADFRVTAL